MQRSPIQQLPTSLVNRIAAGEVIERPASVVKELVENSIDAGATSIIVEIEDGGREVIRVIDDGCGIPPAELALAFAEHATSKLTCDDDLFRIQTMGFRGEALASIGAVSHARILSRTAGNDAAYEIVNRGGLVSDAQAAPGSMGTTVEVRDLFFNMPARRKFLKATSTESGHISDMLLRLALPHPKIAFKLLSGARTSLELPVTTPEQRLLCAWPSEYAEQRLPLQTRDAEVWLWGIVGLPELCSPTAKYQYLYLNGRHIRDRFLQHAMKEAYRGLMEPGRQPAAVLLLTMPAADVDVNVHPTKAEVRFRDSGRLHGLVLSSIREKLLGSDLTPSAVARSDSSAAPTLPPRPDMRARLADFLKQTADDAPGALTLTPPPPPQPLLPMPAAQAAAPAVGAAPAAARGAGVSPASTPAAAETAAPRSTGASPVSQSVPDAVPDVPAPGVTAAPIVNRNSRLANAQALQLHNTYLVTESDDGLIVIDQHALHERIIYEELLARLGRGPLESQRLLIPALVDISQKQLALLEQIQPLLGQLGIEISVFGPEAIAVQSFPTFLDRLAPERFVAEMLERGEQELLDLSQEEMLHELLDMMACKAAIKAGDPLSPQEIQALLSRRDSVERSSNCPHGRPTTLRLSLRDLEKQFKRTGF